MAPKSKSESRDLATFQLLVYAMPDDEPKKIRDRIRRKLKRSYLGDYIEVQVDHLHDLHRALESDIRKFDKSTYWKPTDSEVASSDDYDLERMVDDFRKAFPTVQQDDLRGIIAFAIYVYYLK